MARITKQQQFRAHVGERNYKMLLAVAKGVEAGMNAAQEVMQTSTKFEDREGILRAAITKASKSIAIRSDSVRGFLRVKPRDPKTGDKYASYVKADTFFDEGAIARASEAFLKAGNEELAKLQGEL